MELVVVVFALFLFVLQWLSLALRVSVLFAEILHWPLAFAECLMTLVDVVVFVLFVVAAVVELRFSKIFPCLRCTMAACSC